ncbi:MAG TPA: HEAT repeat domain-containing protein [Gemmatimonadaceae bacterium]
MIRATFIAVALGAFALASEAQNPTPAPTPAPAPSPAAKPSAARPTPAPRAKRAPVPPLPPEWPSVDLSDLADRLDALKDMQLDMDLLPPMNMRIDPEIEMDLDFDVMPRAEEMQRAMDEAMAHIDFDVEMPPMPAIPPMTPMAMEPMLMELPPMPSVEMAPMAPMAIEPITPMPSAISFAPAEARAALARAAAEIERVQGQSLFERQFSGISSEPPQAWAQADPADSIYRLAREALNRGEYRRAAQLFGDITQKFPNSAYAADARYWRAFALYRLGGTSDLHEALNVLQDTGSSFRQARLSTDAPVLATRIRGALAAQGDGQARKALNEAASQPGAACDREDLAVRVEALNSLGQTDPESTTPILRRVLAKRDDCSVSLRRAAIYLLGRRTDAEAMNLVMGAARNDPDIRVRSEALRFLAAMPGDQAISTIEEIARTPGNEQLQRAAISALGRSDSPRARQSLRAIIERADLSESLRATALASIDDDRTPDNGAYLRSLYPKLESPRLKASALRAIARIGGTDNEQWLLSVVRNQNEPVEVRVMALRYAGASTIPIGDLVRMYDVADDRPLRMQLIQLYAQRSNPEATDKLLQIAKTGTDPDMRRMAISALSRKNDPRTKQLLLEIIDK